MVAGDGALWVFRGSRLTELNPGTGRVLASAPTLPVAPAFYSPAALTSTGLWYLAQTSTAQP